MISFKCFLYQNNLNVAEDTKEEDPLWFHEIYYFGINFF